MKTLVVRIPSSTKARLGTIRRRNGVPLAEQVRRAIGAYLAAGPNTREMMRLLHGSTSARRPLAPGATEVK